VQEGAFLRPTWKLLKQLCLREAHTARPSPTTSPRLPIAAQLFTSTYMIDDSKELNIRTVCKPMGYPVRKPSPYAHY